MIKIPLKLECKIAQYVGENIPDANKAIKRFNKTRILVAITVLHVIVTNLH